MADPCPADTIQVRGARVHNLQDLDAEIPRDRLVVLTGVSGSGKSSLAFDTLFAEGQRRYIDGLSTYARQFLDLLERPDVDSIEGLPPTVAIDQKAAATGPRSTVATLTESADYLRLLYARCGLPHCPKCGRPIVRQTPEQMVAALLGLGEGRKLILMAPIVRGRKGQHAEAFATIRRAGLIRARVDGQVVEIGPDDPKLAKTKAHTIEAVVDRLVIRDGIRPRAAESLDLALKLGDGTVVLSIAEGDTWVDRTWSVRLACPDCNQGLDAIEPRTFSFNSPHGACPRCEGLGQIPNDPADPASSTIRCPDCQGARLRPEARAVRLGGLGIDQIQALDLPESRAFLASLTFEPPLDQVGPPLIREINRRIAFLERVGLDYLTLDRPAPTLSGGELQRVRLATQIGSGLVDVCFVLDEPTAGLHPRDTDRLLASLIDLRDRGNSVVVVEHDEATIRSADWLIDLGPGAGPLGGRIVAQGPPGNLVETEPGISLTRAQLEAVAPNPGNATGRLERSPGRIRVVGAAEHNLQTIDAEFPVGCITAVTGVSGSGKSTLVMDVLAPAASRFLGLGSREPGAHQRIDGLEAIDQVVTIDQSAIGRTPRATPATYTGVFDAIRQVFARARESKVRGYNAARFSFNRKGGRCESCQGQGVRRLAMNFLPDAVVPCDECDGRRFNRPTLAVHYRGQSIADVLAMKVDEALAFFDAVPRVRGGLEALRDAGLGYITLGQPASTLSGGEAQRVKLAAELGRAGTGRALLILDEPTTGLHFADVATLREILDRLANRGNTLVVIEHNPDLIRTADWILDLGPDGGRGGGRIVAQGTPQQVADNPESITGPYLLSQSA